MRSRASALALAAALTVPVVLAAVPSAAGAAPATGGTAAAPSTPGTSQPGVVSTVPQTGTPNIHDGAVFAVAQVGTTVVVGGSFTTTESAADPSSLVSTPYLLAYDARTGALLTSFAPRLSGGGATQVNALLPGPTPGTVYVGGVFNQVNGAAVKGLAVLDVADGSRVTSFPAVPFDLGNVQALRVARGRLFVGGAFQTVAGAPHAGLVTLNPTTGALDPWLTSSVAVNHSWTPSSPSTASKAPVGVYKLDVTPDGSKLVAIGNFKQVDGATHDQIALWDLTGTTSALRPWNTTKFQALCNTNAFDYYVRDVQFSPDSSYFVVVASGGYGPSGSLCDSATRWEGGATGADVAYTWVDYTGKDTLLSTAITSTAIYVGGHERWLNNPLGTDNPGPGAVPRPSVAALDPATGLPLAWNPGRNPRGAGTYTLVATADGLFMGSDQDFVGPNRYRRGKIAFFPLAGGAPVTGKAVSSLPANVVTGVTPAPGSTGVLYRVNAGGPLLRSVDAGPDWAADSSGTSPYRNTGSTASPYPSPVLTVDSTVPAGTPSAVFSSERYDGGAKGDGGEMQWRFSVPAGTPVDVRLYFANRAGGTQGIGKRTFDIAIDGTTQASGFDISAAAGDQTGTMRSFPVVSDGSVDVSFTHGVNNPLVSAVELVRSGTGPWPSAAGSVTSRSFTGTTAGTPAPVSPSTSLDPATVRAATVVGGLLYYVKTDGKLYRRPVPGGSWGAETLVDPYNDPVWSGVQTGSGGVYRGTAPGFFTRATNVTSMAFDGVGRLYYTLYGTTGLFTRTFSPDSGVMGSDETQVPGNLPTTLTGAFLSGSTFYYATSDGALRSQPFGGLSGLSGAATVVSSPATTGASWAGSLLYLDVQNQAPTAAASVTCTDLTCTAEAGGSTDPDGSIASYSWSWGDGTAPGSGVSATHTYAAGGAPTVTLTVTDNGGATASTATTVTVSPHVNVAPTAAFSATCQVLTCTLDATASSDSDGSIASYAWALGDGTTATGRTVSRTYGSGGARTVTLTVTDDAGATGTTSQTVTPTSAPASSIAFRASTSGVGNAALPSGGSSTTPFAITVPAATQAGDTLLVDLSVGTAAAPAAPSGWTELSRTSWAATGTQVVWTRRAAAGDGGTSVPVSFPATSKYSWQALAYSGVSATTAPVVKTYADTFLSGTHSTPSATVTTAGSWVVWSWSDKSSTTTSWTLPAGATSRAAGVSLSSGAISGIVADGGAWPAGSVPAQTAATAPSGSTSKGVMTTVVLAPTG